MSSRSELKSQDVPKFFSPVSGRTRRKAPASSQLETAEEDSPSKTGRAQPSLDDNNNFFKLLESMQLDESFEHPTTSYSTTYSAKFSLLPEISPPSSEYTDDLPPADDEQTVNAALVDFLKALTMHFQIPMEWSFRRRAFFCNDTKGRGFEARVDGCLRQINSDIPLAIVKVKSCIRENHIEAIRMQEGAQMAAWISSYPDFCSRHKQKDKKRTRLLISQDRHEVYLTFAKYNQSYVDYVKGIKNANTFLEMYEHGPFALNDTSKVQRLGWFFLTYVLQEQP